MHRLEVPDASPRVRVEREQRIGEQILSEPLTAVEVRRRRSERNEHDAARLVDTHLRPAVRAANAAVGVGLPCLRAQLAGQRDGVKGPSHGAGSHVERSHVSGCRAL